MHSQTVCLSLMNRPMLPISSLNNGFDIWNLADETFLRLLTIKTNFNYDKRYLYNTSTGSVTSDKELDNYTLGFTYQKIEKYYIFAKLSLK